MPASRGTRPSGRKAPHTGGLKALLTSGALAAILWLWVVFAAPERSQGETAEAAPEPPPVPPIALRQMPLPTLVPPPTLESRARGNFPTPTTRRSVSSAPGLRSIQAPPPPPAPRVIQVPGPSGSKPAAVTRSSR